jgi:hypothetical protein
LSFLLQTDPKRRPNCDKFLNNPLILRRTDYDDNKNDEKLADLMGTIKFPKNLSEINKILPKKTFFNTEGNK